MAELNVNGQSMSVGEYRELKVPRSEAQVKLQGNGLDELYFEKGGKEYVAYAERISFSALKKGTLPASGTLDGEPIEIKAYSKDDSLSSKQKVAIKATVAIGAAAAVGAGVVAGCVASLPFTLFAVPTTGFVTLAKLDDIADLINGAAFSASISEITVKGVTK